MRLITQAIYDETKFLLRKFPNATQKQIGKLVNSGWGGISQRTVWLINESNSFDEYRQKQANHHLEEDKRKKPENIVPITDEKPTIAEKPDEIPNEINLRRISELLWCIAYELNKGTMPLFMDKGGQHDQTS